MNTNEELWKSALGEIEINVPKASFLTWFKDTSILDRNQGVITISVPNGFAKAWIENKYNKFILGSLRNLSPDIKEILYVIGQGNLQQPELKKKDRVRDEIPLEETSALFKGSSCDVENSLNPRYTFLNFVIGSFNELAHAAARATIENIGKTYNPLFIYGGVGLGKTHLIQAVGNEVRSSQQKKNVYYIPTERFTSELVMSIQRKNVDVFKEKYRKADILILDDVQFIAGKEKTQEEFFHIFNALYEKNKQIIISSDRPPKAIPALEERLVSRFEGGMVADISYPDFETRLAILKNKVEVLGYSLGDDILNYVATHVQKNIRELEGALTRIAANARIVGRPPTLNSTARLLSKTINIPKRNITIAKVLQVVSDFYGVEHNEILNQSRKQGVVRPRQIAMYLIREELKSSYPYIGEKFGGKDHTTVIHAVGKIRKEIDANQLIEEEINLIKERLYA